MTVEKQNDCSSHFQVHDMLIKQQGEKIDNMNNEIRGMPECIKGLTVKIEEMVDLIKETRDDYQPKSETILQNTIYNEKLKLYETRQVNALLIIENLKTSNLNLEKEVIALRKDLKSLDDKNEDRFTKIVWSALLMFAGMAFTLIRVFLIGG